MGGVGVTGAHPRKPGTTLLLLVLGVIPAAAAFGNPVIFHLFGNGNYLPNDSTGAHVLQWWDTWGRPLCVGAAALVLLVACRVRPVWSLGLAALAVGASYIWLVIVFLLDLAGAGTDGS